MNITPILKDDTLKLIIEGRLDTFGAEPVQKALDAYFNEHPKFIILDMTKVDFISSAGIRVLLIAAKETKIRDGILALVGLNNYCRELISTTHIDALLSQFESIDQAEDFCRNAGHR